MKTTLKVAELASFIYAFLFFGSLCINMVYYSIFNINITSYMKMPEILLLFLGQPILYIPILISILILVLNPQAWPQEKNSYKQKYMSIASTNDSIFVCLIIINFIFLYFLYDIKIDILFTCCCSTCIIWIFIPSQGNVYIQHYAVNVITNLPKEFQRIWNLIRKKELPKKQSIFQRALAITNNESVPDKYKKDPYKKYRILILESKITKSEKNMLNMIYHNKLLYCITITYIASIISMCSINYLLANSLKDGSIPPNKIVTLYFSNPSDCFETNSDYIYIGESNQYIFLFEPKRNESIIVNRDIVNVQRVKFNSERKEEIYKKLKIDD